MIKKNITLIDYENVRDVSSEGYRYLGFGRFAGIIGTYNTLKEKGIIDRSDIQYIRLDENKSIGDVGL